MPGPALAHNASEYTPVEAEEYARLTITQNYVLYATSTLLVYELLTTFDVEVERVWSLKWRLPKILFVFNRYITRALLILQFIAGGYPGTSERFCDIYGYWQVIPPRLAILVAQALMVIRLWAIYNNSKPMLHMLLLLYTLEVVTVVACMSLAVASTEGTSQPTPLSCGLDALSPSLRQYASGTWIAPLCFELIVLILTLVKVFPPPLACRHLGRAKLFKGLRIATHNPRNPTLDILARDSVIYFALVFTFTLTNAFLYELSFSAYYRSILLGPTSAISCIAVSRMIINIRSLPDPSTELSDGGGRSTNMVSSGVVFADNSAFDNEDSASEADRRRFSGSRKRGRVTGKEREMGVDVTIQELPPDLGYEMISLMESGEVLNVKEGPRLHVT